MRDPHTDLEINCRAQLSILEACRRNNPAIKVIFSSTRQIYGVPRYLPVDEEHPLAPIDINGINKVAGESYHLIYSRVHGIRTCVLRLTNTYGPRMRVKDDRQTFLGVWFKRLIEGQPLLRLRRRRADPRPQLRRRRRGRHADGRAGRAGRRTGLQPRRAGPDQPARPGGADDRQRTARAVANSCPSRPSARPSTSAAITATTG